MDRAELAILLGFRGKGRRGAGRPRVVADSDPARFMRALARAAGGAGPVFLADPGWGAREREVLRTLARLPCGERAGGEGWLMIPTGGTSGQVKFARHDAATLAAAVGGFCAHFRCQRVHCVGVLPLHHVSGLMAWMRAAMTGGEYIPWDWRRLEEGERPRRPRRTGFCSVSLVPTQLQRLMASAGARSWLRGFDAVMVGGGPLWKDLEEAARAAGLPLSITYGMTETAAMVAALRPREFLADAGGGLAPMPHARVHATGLKGRIAVAGPSVFRGYYPDWRRGRGFTTEDLGRFDAKGRLHVLGRHDSVIITGGKKVDPAEVEAALRASGEFSDLAIVGVPDPSWGQAVVACYPAASAGPDLDRAASTLSRLSAHKRPKRYVAFEVWPRNAQGKLNRAELLRRL